MLPVAVGILVAGLLALLASIVLFLAFRFERFVGVRYLRRGRTSRAVKVALVVSIVAAAGGLVLFLATRGQARHLETIGVVLALLGLLFALLFLLLRLFSVFTTVSTMGVVLGVASLVVVLAVTSGFEREFQSKVLSLNGHLIVTGYGIERSIEELQSEADAIKNKLRDYPGVTRMTKFSFSAGDVMIGRVGAMLKGVDVSEPAPELDRAMIAGKFADLARPVTACPNATLEGTAGQDPWTGRIALGTDLAKRLGAKMGDCVQVLVPFSGGSASAPSALAFRVIGVFELGFNEYDARVALLPLEDAMKLGNAPLSIFGVELRFEDATDAIRAERPISARLGSDFRVLDFRSMNHNLFTALVMQKLIIALILVLIIVVAAFNIVASLTLIVLSKVREIAILSSMGARPSSLLRIFVVAGGFVGFVGTGLGVLYGLAVCGLAQLYRYELDAKVYLIDKLPVEISAPEILFVAAATQLICLVATLYPALRAGRLKVVDGLRYI